MARVCLLVFLAASQLERYGLAAEEENAGALSSSQTFTKLEGESISFGCAFNPPQGSKFFIKKGLESETLLIQTSDDPTQRDRFSIGFDGDIFYVRIVRLKQSDSGHFRCGVGNSSSPDLQRDFELRVTDEMCDGGPAPAAPAATVCSEAEGGTMRVTCSFSSADLFNLFFCKDGCKKREVLVEASGFTAQRGRFRIEYEKKGVFHVTISNLTTSDSGLYSCGVDVTSAPNPCKTVEIRVTSASQIGSASKAAAKSCVLSTSGLSTSGLSTSGLPTDVSQTVELSEDKDAEDNDVTETASNGFSVLLIVCLAVFAVLLLTVLLLLYLKKRIENRSNIPK
ncbi:polymeric immunoglobulin receptor-like isoform X2 [Leuresthes tenuis]|uniref:polymeric immunoglobulin receptor-like isoform X2 n=1 Tax=Leuresthes tenuis TaxID=355514 RepID=UPI003B51018D